MFTFVKAMAIVLLYMSMPFFAYYGASDVAEAFAVSEMSVVFALIAIYFVIPYACIAFYPLIERGLRKLRRMSRAYGGNQFKDEASIEADPYAVLGLDSQATNEEIKRAFHAMLRRYHPDRVERRDQVVRSIALEMTKAVTLAFSKIRKERNF